ncbi:nucleoside deaminase [Nocardia sp. CDC159]|uniref:Nucleoside deaminase n=1 Tax=Nocardia pulmonis TaxID=2951408 RepID=A0A9X2ECI7_9NOCA|nr:MULTISPECIES: nucleoside deaminase [Nocardia]MCM6777860.1 nucleoside deaminase [Nocardia pulmonis]MCM6790744.1 nucleoside deaminase [Nocardia sp. CDC159]
MTASVAALVGGAAGTGSATPTCELDEPTRSAPDRLLGYRPTLEEQRFHALRMAQAIRVAAGNPKYPFGAVIVDDTGTILSEGVNKSAFHPGHHGEVVAINSYIDRHGNSGWPNTTLYTTGEPCAMCMGMIAWAKIPRVVWASSVDVIGRSGIGQIAISAIELAARSHGIYQPRYLIGGVCAEVMDPIFLNRPR